MTVRSKTSRWRLHGVLSRLRPRRPDTGADRGAAVLSVLLVMTVATALATTATVLGIDNLGNANRDRQGSAALDVSEAGIAQGIAYLRSHGVGAINACTATPASCTLDWGMSPGHTVTITTAQSYQVWIQATSPYAPPTTVTGTYTIHSKGSAGTGPGARSVAEDVAFTPFSFPIGVFGRQVNSGGNGGIHYESLFTTGCVYKRTHTSFQGVDAYYGIPAAAHSSQYITDSNGSGPTCSPDRKSDHASGACNSSLPYDDDHQGGPLTSGDGCYGGYTWKGAPYNSSYIADAASLGSRFGFNTGGLTSSQLDALRTLAQSQGLYITGTTAIPAVLQGANAHVAYPNPVLFYDLKGSAVGGTVDLNGLTGYSRSYPLSASDPACTPYGAVVVVLNGNVKLNANSVLVASVFAPSASPYGQVAKANGGAQLIGTLYADTIDLTGTADVYLDQCFLQNLPGGLANLAARNFREGDRPIH